MAFQYLDSTKDIPVNMFTTEPYEFRSAVGKHLEIIQSLLRGLVSSLEQNESLFAVLVLPIGDGQMRVVAAENIPRKYLERYAEFYGRFMWGKNISGIAGLCATKNETILIPDTRFMAENYQKYFVHLETPNETRGILCVPVLQHHDKGEHCIAVISISSSEYGILGPRHNDISSAMSEAFRQTVHNLVTVTAQYLRTHEVESNDITIYNTKPVKERTAEATEQANLITEQRQQPIDTELSYPIADIIDEIRSNWRIEHPTKLELVLLMFANSPDGLLPMESLIPLFATANRPERQARNLIPVLNEKLEKYGLELQHVSAYRLVKRKED